MYKDQQLQTFAVQVDPTEIAFTYLQLSRVPPQGQITPWNGPPRPTPLPFAHGRGVTHTLPDDIDAMYFPQLVNPPIASPPLDPVCHSAVVVIPSLKGTEHYRSRSGGRRSNHCRATSVRWFRSSTCAMSMKESLVLAEGASLTTDAGTQTKLGINSVSCGCAAVYSAYRTGSLYVLLTMGEVKFR